VEAWLKGATSLKNQLSFIFGPPYIAKPSNEMYAEFLLLDNRPDEARYFEAALKNEHQREYLSLKGMLHVAVIKNDLKTIESAEEELRNIYISADKAVKAQI
jgi:hypothetical protein